MINFRRGISVTLLFGTSALLVPIIPAISGEQSVCALYMDYAPNSTTEAIRSSVAGHAVRLTETFAGHDPKQAIANLNTFAAMGCDAIMMLAAVEKMNSVVFPWIQDNYRGPLIVFDTRYPVSGTESMSSLLSQDLRKMGPVTFVLSRAATVPAGGLQSRRIDDILKTFGPTQIPGSNSCTTVCSYNNSKACCEKVTDKCDC
jgi:hypothetical protein